MMDFNFIKIIVFLSEIMMNSIRNHNIRRSFLSGSSSIFDDPAWNIRRSERVFLKDVVAPSTNESAATGRTLSPNNSNRSASSESGSKVTRGRQTSSAGEIRFGCCPYSKVAFRNSGIDERIFYYPAITVGFSCTCFNCTFF